MLERRCFYQYSVNMGNILKVGSRLTTSCSLNKLSHADGADHAHDCILMPLFVFSAYVGVIPLSGSLSHQKQSEYFRGAAQFGISKPLIKLRYREGFTHEISLSPVAAELF